MAFPSALSEYVCTLVAQTAARRARSRWVFVLAREQKLSERGRGRAAGQLLTWSWSGWVRGRPVVLAARPRSARPVAAPPGPRRLPRAHQPRFPRRRFRRRSRGARPRVRARAPSSRAEQAAQPPSGQTAPRLRSQRCEVHCRSCFPPVPSNGRTSPRTGQTVIGADRICHSPRSSQNSPG
jgi:hypothetical protein